MSTLHQIWTELKTAWSSDAQKKHTEEAIPFLRGRVEALAGTYTDKAYKETHQAMQAMRWYFGNDKNFTSYLEQMQESNPQLYDWIDFSTHQVVEHQLPEEKRKARLERKQFDDSSYGVGKAVALVTLLLAAGMAGCVHADAPTVTTPSNSSIYPVNHTPTPIHPIPTSTPATQTGEVPQTQLSNYVPIPSVDIAKNNTAERETVQLRGQLLENNSETLNETESIAQKYLENGVLSKKIENGRVLFYGQKTDEDADDIPDWMEETVLKTSSKHKNMIWHVYLMNGTIVEKESIYDVKSFWQNTNFTNLDGEKGVDVDIKFIPAPYKTFSRPEWEGLSSEDKRINIAIAMSRFVIEQGEKSDYALVALPNKEFGGAWGHMIAPEVRITSPEPMFTRYSFAHELAHEIVGDLKEEDRFQYSQDGTIYTEFGHANATKYPESVLRGGLGDNSLLDIGMDFENRYIIPRGTLHATDDRYLHFFAYAQLPYRASL